MNDNLINQTSFSHQEPVWEQPPEFEKENPQADSQPLPNKHKKVVIVVAIIVVAAFLLLGIVLLAFLNQKNDAPEIITASPSPISQQIEKLPLEEKLESLEILLERADPIKEDLLIPPINPDISLE